jgi:hypothetical protein
MAKIPNPISKVLDFKGSPSPLKLKMIANVTAIPTMELGTKTTPPKRGVLFLCTLRSLGLSKYPFRLHKLSIHGINSMDVSAEAMKDMKI